MSVQNPSGAMSEDTDSGTDVVKAEAEEDVTTTPREIGEVVVKAQDVKEEEDHPVPSPTRKLTTIDYMYGPDETAKETKPKHPHTTRFPDFPHIPNRIVPHPLDRLSWFKPELSFPPPDHLHTHDNGNSLFEVDFSRQPNDLGGGSQATINKHPRLLCYSGWHAPADQVDRGGPYCVTAPVEWYPDWEAMEQVEKWGTTEGYPEQVADWERTLGRKKKKGEVPPPEHDGSMSLFYNGGGTKHANTWRYRGDVKMDKQVRIGPEQFAKMGEEEKLQWINYFRFENVIRRFRIPHPPTNAPPEPWRSPNELFKYLSTPGSRSLTFTVLRVVGYNQDRIDGWMEQRRKRSSQRRNRSVVPEPVTAEEKPVTRANRKRSRAPGPVDREEKPITRSSRTKSIEAPSPVVAAIPEVEEEKPIQRTRSGRSKPFVEVPERKPSKRLKEEV